MQKWEYETKRLRFFPNDPRFDREVWEGDLDLAKMGLEGWELISVVSLANNFIYPGLTKDVFFYFKRPIE
jgi:hypothetical protein